MNCWKSVNVRKEIGYSRLFHITIFISLITFLILYVPFSIIHKQIPMNDHGVLPLLVGILLLPSLHSLVHILTLILMKQRVKIKYKRKLKIIPILTYYTRTYITKKVSLINAIAPTVVITIPGILACYLFADYYLYILLFTCLHIGLTYIDFWCLTHIIKAPKEAIIQNESDGFDILLEAN